MGDHLVVPNIVDEDLKYNKSSPAYIRKSSSNARKIRKMRNVRHTMDCMFGDNAQHKSTHHMVGGISGNDTQHMSELENDGKSFTINGDPQDFINAPQNSLQKHILIIVIAVTVLIIIIVVFWMYFSSMGVDENQEDDNTSAQVLSTLDDFDDFDNFDNFKDFKDDSQPTAQPLVDYSERNTNQALDVQNSFEKENSGVSHNLPRQIVMSAPQRQIVIATPRLPRRQIVMATPRLPQRQIVMAPPAQPPQIVMTPPAQPPQIVMTPPAQPPQIVMTPPAPPPQVVMMPPAPPPQVVMTPPQTTTTFSSKLHPNNIGTINILNSTSWGEYSFDIDKYTQIYNKIKCANVSET